MNVAILLFAALLAATPVEPTARWNGMIADESLQKLASVEGFLADAESLAKVWKAWRPTEEVPTVDFTKEIIVVGVVPGPNLVLMRPSLDEKGDLQFVVAGTRKGGPGFGYLMVKVSREGIKTVNGKPLEASGVRGVLLIPEKVGSFTDYPAPNNVFIALAADPPADESISVTVVGTLRTGIVAIGGETTGSTITARGVTWELDFGKNAELRKAAEKLDGKKVTVSGTLERRAGVEVKERWIVTVGELHVAGDQRRQ